MLFRLRISSWIPFIILAAAMLLTFGCGVGEPIPPSDLEATVEARVSATVTAHSNLVTPEIATPDMSFARTSAPVEDQAPAEGTRDATPPTPAPAVPRPPESTAMPEPTPAPALGSPSTPASQPVPTATQLPVPASTLAALPSPTPPPTLAPISGPDLQVFLEAGTTEIIPDADLVIGFTVENLGPEDDDDVVLEFSHSSLFVPVSITPEGNCSNLNCNVGSLKANESMNGGLILRAKVFLDQEVASPSRVGVRAHGSKLDLDWSNNESSLTFDFLGDLPGHLLWSTALPFGLHGLIGDLLVNDEVFFGAGHDIYAVSKSTGEIRWQRGLEDRSMVIGFHDGSLIATDGDVYSLDPSTGDVNWKYLTEPGHDGPGWTRLVDDSIYLRPLNQPALYSIDADTGALNWKYSPGSEIGRVDPISIEDGNILVVQSMTVLSIDANTGDIKWIYEADDFPDFYIRPILFNDRIYFITRKHIYGIDSATGEVSLVRPASMLFDHVEDQTRKLYLTGGIFSDGKVYFGISNLDVFALDEEMENVIWHYKYGGDPPTGRFSKYVGYARNAMVYLILPAGRTRDGETLENADGIYALDDWSGRLLWHFESEGGTFDLTFHRDVVYAAALDGFLETFDSRTGELRRRIGYGGEGDKINVRTIFAISDGVLYGLNSSRVFALKVEP